MQRSSLQSPHFSGFPRNALSPRFSAPNTSRDSICTVKTQSRWYVTVVSLATKQKRATNSTEKLPQPDANTKTTSLTMESCSQSSSPPATSRSNSTPSQSPSAPASPDDTESAEQGQDVAHTPPQPPSPPRSRFFRSPTPQPLKPRLEDFSYRSIPFPAQPPRIVPSSSPLDLTIALISQMLESRNNDVALVYMADHLVSIPGTCHISQLTAVGCATSVHAPPDLEGRRERGRRLHAAPAVLGQCHGVVHTRSRQGPRQMLGVPQRAVAGALRRVHRAHRASGEGVVYQLLFQGTVSLVPPQDRSAIVSLRDTSLTNKPQPAERPQVGNAPRRSTVSATRTCVRPPTKN